MFELFLASLWIIGLNLTLLLPVALLAAVAYRWNVRLLALAHDREALAAAPTSPWRAGFWLFRRSMAALSPPWYVLLGLLLLALAVHALLPIEDLGVIFKLHWLAYHASVVVSVILTSISGTLLFSFHMNSPTKLLMAAAAWVLGMWIFLWLLTPEALFDATRTYTWGERNFVRVPLYPLVVPAYSIVLFAAGVYRTGVNIGRSAHQD